MLPYFSFGLSEIKAESIKFLLKYRLIGNPANLPQPYGIIMRILLRINNTKTAKYITISEGNLALLSESTFFCRK